MLSYPIANQYLAIFSGYSATIFRGLSIAGFSAHHVILSSLSEPCPTARNTVENCHQGQTGIAATKKRLLPTCEAARLTKVLLIFYSPYPLAHTGRQWYGSTFRQAKEVSSPQVHLFRSPVHNKSACQILERAHLFISCRLFKVSLLEPARIPGKENRNIEEYFSVNAVCIDVDS